MSSRCKSLVLLIALFFLAPRASYAYNELTYYSIDSMQRGADLVTLINTTLPSYFSTATTPEILIQTANFSLSNSVAPGIYNGVIPFVQSITAATNYTMFIVAYRPSSNQQVYYVVLNIEQIVGVVYSPVGLNVGYPGPGGITPAFPSNELPLLKVNPAYRAADIQNIVNTLYTTSPYNNNPQFHISVQTSIQATIPGQIYTTNVIVNPSSGYVFVPNVQNPVTLISPNSTILLFNYKSLNNQNFLYQIPVNVEQVQQVIYYPNASY